MADSNLNIDQIGERFANLKLFEAAEIAKFSPAERRDYEESMKNFRDLFASLETKYNAGHRKGLDEGIAIGRDEGIAIAEARAHQEKLKNALSFYKNGMGSMDQIAKIMNLDLDELKNFVSDR